MSSSTASRAPQGRGAQKRAAAEGDGMQRTTSSSSAATVVVSSTGFTSQEKLWLAELCRRVEGASLQGDLQANVCTHLVCRSLVACANTPKYTRALQWGVKVVSWKWLLDSAAAGRALPANAYKDDPTTPLLDALRATAPHLLLLQPTSRPAPARPSAPRTAAAAADGTCLVAAQRNAKALPQPRGAGKVPPSSHVLPPAAGALPPAPLPTSSDFSFPKVPHRPSAGGPCAATTATTTGDTPTAAPPATKPPPQQQQAEALHGRCWPSNLSSAQQQQEEPEQPPQGGPRHPDQEANDRAAAPPWHDIVIPGTQMADDDDLLGPPDSPARLPRAGHPPRDAARLSDAPRSIVMFVQARQAALSAGGPATASFSSASAAAAAPPPSSAATPPIQRGGGGGGGGARAAVAPSPATSLLLSASVLDSQADSDLIMITSCSPRARPRALHPHATHLDQQQQQEGQQEEEGSPGAGRGAADDDAMVVSPAVASQRAAAALGRLSIQCLSPVHSPAGGGAEGGAAGGGPTMMAISPLPGAAGARNGGDGVEEDEQERDVVAGSTTDGSGEDEDEEGAGPRRGGRPSVLYSGFGSELGGAAGAATFEGWGAEGQREEEQEQEGGGAAVPAGDDPPVQEEEEEEEEFGDGTERWEDDELPGHSLLRPWLLQRAPAPPSRDTAAAATPSPPSAAPGSASGSGAAAPVPSSSYSLVTRRKATRHVAPSGFTPDSLMVAGAPEQATASGDAAAEAGGRSGGASSGGPHVPAVQPWAPPQQQPPPPQHHHHQGQHGAASVVGLVAVKPEPCEGLAPGPVHGGGTPRSADVSAAAGSHPWGHQQPSGQQQHQRAPAPALPAGVVIKQEPLDEDMFDAGQEQQQQPGDAAGPSPPQQLQQEQGGGRGVVGVVAPKQPALTMASGSCADKAAAVQQQRARAGASSAAGVAGGALVPLLQSRLLPLVYARLQAAWAAHPTAAGAALPGVGPPAFESRSQVVVVEVKPRARMPQSSTVLAAHRLQAAKQVRFAEQVELQVVPQSPQAGGGAAVASDAGKLLLVARDKAKHVVCPVIRRTLDVHGRPVAEGSPDQYAVVEPLVFYRLPDGTWWLEFHELLDVGQASRRASAAGAARLALPEDVKPERELLRDVCCQHARLSQVVCCVAVSRSKRGPSAAVAKEALRTAESLLSQAAAGGAVPVEQLLAATRQLELGQRFEFDSETGQLLTREPPVSSLVLDS